MRKLSGLRVLLVQSPAPERSALCDTLDAHGVELSVAADPPP